MRKLIAILLVILISMGCMTACSNSGNNETQPVTTEQPVPTDTPIPTEAKPSASETAPSTLPTEPETQLGNEDTYWVAETYLVEDEPGPQTLEPEMRRIDLVVRADGTARFRDIREDVLIQDDSMLHLTWECTQDGEYLFYSVLYTEPVLIGTLIGEDLSLYHWGMTLQMKQQPIPQTIGQFYDPAELTGTWVMVSGETEGYQYEAMPAELSSIVFHVDSPTEGVSMLKADMEELDYFGNKRFAAFGQGVEILDEPLYAGCENEDWSVRIGEESAMDENGFPLETEMHATLIGENTMLLQRYYTMDGYPAVSYQTLMRFTDLNTWIDPVDMELGESTWVCTGYEDLSGSEKPLPEELNGFKIFLDSDQTCYFCHDDVSTQIGTWTMGNGGVMRLHGDEEQDDPYWFGGAVSGYWVEAPDSYTEDYQMALYYNGGILKLALESYG